MKKDHVFFNNGLFEKPIMNSRIKTASMTMKEKILGYLVGPFGMLAFMAMANQLLELYYTEVFYIDQIFGVGTYLIMSWIVRIVGMLAGLVIAYVVEHTVSTQGKFRPLILIGSFTAAVAGFLMFWMPEEMPNTWKLVWVYIFNLLYNCVGAALFNLRYNLYVLATRNQNDRNQINLFNNISGYLLVGTAVTMVVGSVLYYTMLHGHPAQNWIMLIGLTAVASIPFSIIHYYYTLERITNERSKQDQIAQITQAKDYEAKQNVWQQIRALFKSKYWLLALAFNIVTGIVNNLSGYNLNTNFCTVVLGATAENNYNLIYTIASGVPMGLGILIVYPLCKKYTIRKTTMAFSAICIIGCVMGLIVKNDFWPVVVANFIYNFGTLPVIYIIGALTGAAGDEVEYKHNFRPEGTVAAAVIGCVTAIVTGLFAGVYETGLSSAGYLPELGVNQPEAVVNWLYFVRYGAQIINNAAIIIIMHFMDLEKHLPGMQKEIQERRKAEAEARGEVWVSPEELAAQEKAENERLAEEARIADLRAKCLKKGLDFDSENQKYLDKLVSKRK